MGKKRLAVILSLALLLSMLVLSIKDSTHKFDDLIGGASSVSDGASSDVDTDDSLLIWYADDALTEYLNAAALSYSSEKGIKVKIELVSGVDYLERINNASIYSGETDSDGNVLRTPDIYITTHDTLTRAYLAGLATEVADPHETLLPANYPKTALNAISYDGKYVAYPLYYETNYFLYNKTYMQNLATERVNAEADRLEGLAAQAALDSGEINPEEEQKEEQEENREANEADEGLEDDFAEGEEENIDADPMGNEDVEASPEVLKRLSTMIPSTIDDIKDFANNYDAPEAVEAVFKWDVSDIFYNYFFIGNYINIGGDGGDNNLLFNVYNEQAVEALRVYQDLNNFFSIDAKDVSYDKIIQDFIDGKMVFTVATTDAVRKIDDAKRDGKFDFEYGVAVLPDVSRVLKSRGLSVTTVAAINGYSDKKPEANDFASYISYEKGQEFYRLAGKISCKRECVYENNEIYNIMNEYEKSVPLPKMMEIQDYWVQLEIAFTGIWNGADPDVTLKELSDTLSSQLSESDYHVPFQESFGFELLNN